MTVRSAMRSALDDTYSNSWRLLVVNTTISAVIALVVIFVSAFPLVLLVAPLVAGPVIASLVYCVVTLVRDDDLAVADAAEGLRRFWRTGFFLGALMGAVLLAGALAVTFYWSHHRALPLAVFCAYVAAVAFLVLVVAWVFAIDDPEAGVPGALREAGLVALRSPLRLFALGFVLLIVNVVGIVTVLPFLTLTIAYSFLAAAHVVLPSEPSLEEVPA